MRPLENVVDEAVRHPYLAAMGMDIKRSPGGRRSITAVTRIRREAAIIEGARAEVAAGQGIEDEALDGWLDALDVDENAPPPVPVSTRRI